MPEYPNPKLYTGSPMEPPTAVTPCAQAYAELDVTTNFSFLQGASHPDEMVYTAAMLGYRALAITDINSLAGVVRAYDAARKIEGFHLIVGARLVFADGSPDLLAWPTDRAAYARLCRLLTLGRRRAPKGECHLMLNDFLEHSEGMLGAVVLGGGEERSDEAMKARSDEGKDKTLSPSPSSLRRFVAPSLSSFPPSSLRRSVASSLSPLKSTLRDRLSLAACALRGPDDESRLRALHDLSRQHGIPLLATNHVHYHDPGRRRLQDVLTCIRHGCTIAQAGHRLFANGERYLKSPEQMHRLFKDYPQAIRRGIEIAQRCTFSLGELKYEYPDELVPTDRTSLEYLAELTWAGAAERYPAGVPEKVRRQVLEELELIEKLKFEPYFLTVYDIVKHARSLDILCQGRGSAANSAVCYCLGITSVDPAVHDLLFARFVSTARNEPPDIDVDFEHERREEVIQYIYEKYGRDRAGMTATVITYRGRSAIRDVGKALGLPLDRVDSMAKRLDWWDRGTLNDGQLRECGIDPADTSVKNLIDLTAQLLGFPRHLSQHTGGMVMTRGPLCELVPIENASMENRTVVEWDKDDIETLGILKVDVLALGMLTVIGKGLRELNRRHEGKGSEARMEDGRWKMEEEDRAPGGDDAAHNHQGRSESPSPLPSPLRTGEREKEASSSILHPLSSILALKVPPLRLHTLPPEDPLVYDMICDADTVGVFQVESRAQMAMLPRLRPRCFYDLVIEVAIVRPGPIQGDMVHPYLRRRSGMEPVTFPSEALRGVLHHTLGVPLFQEQAMKVVMVAAGFSGTEADELRRAMAAWKKSTALERFHEKIVRGMLANGYTQEFAEQTFHQIRGFGEYGFPESHAASFARLVYASAWLKRHHPAVFCVAMLNSQPMGFYQPAQLVRDAKEHGVEVRAVDVNASEWDCTLEGGGGSDEATERRSDEGEERRHEGMDARSHEGACSGEAKDGGSATERDERQAENVSCLSSSPPSLRRSVASSLPPSPPSSHPSPKHTWGLHGPAVRLGFRQVKGMRKDHAEQIVAARRQHGPFASVSAFHRLTRLPVATLRRLAEADAFGSMGLSRRQALWEVLRLKDGEEPLFDGGGEVNTRMEDAPETRMEDGGWKMEEEGGAPGGDAGGRECRDHSASPSPLPSPLRTGEKEEEWSSSILYPPSSILASASSSIFHPPCSPSPPLPPMPLGQEVLTDYATAGLSLKSHPVALVRGELAKRKIITASAIADVPHGKWVKVAGLVLIRQRPGTASGVVFETLEDETGIINLILWPTIYDRFRPAARYANLLEAQGYVQRQGQVVHVLAKRLFDLSGLLAGLDQRSRDFH